MATLGDFPAVAFGDRPARTGPPASEKGQAKRDATWRHCATLRVSKTNSRAKVWHELRTPLTIIHDYSEPMVDWMFDTDKLVRVSAGEIHTSSTLMLRLVDDLLDTSPLDAGRIELKCTGMSPPGWLERWRRRSGRRASHTASWPSCPPSCR